jgi:CRP-like cAMP-binding protein
MDHFLRGRVAQLTEAQRSALEEAVSDRRRLPPRSVLIDRGEVLRHSTMLVEGFMIRFIDDQDGERQIVAFHVPGDFVDLHGYPLEILDHGIASVTEAEVAIVPHRALETLTERDPDLGRTLWAATLLDASIHREWLFRLGRLNAVGRIAHFILETDARLQAIGHSDGRRFILPITQADLGEITGLTSIHINRVLRMLREERICIFRSSTVEILDPERLARIGQFDPAYLYLRSGAGLDRHAVSRTTAGEEMR